MMNRYPSPLTIKITAIRRASGLFLLGFIFFAQGAISAESTVLETASSKELQLTVQQIEKELSLRAQTKKERIQKAEKNFHTLNNRHSWKKAAIGAVVTAAVTANPVGAVLGGVFGGFLGRSENYNKIEEKVAEMEQEIIVSEEDFLTSEEVRLEHFTRIPVPFKPVDTQLERAADDSAVGASDAETLGHTDAFANSANTIDGATIVIPPPVHVETVAQEQRINIAQNRQDDQAQSKPPKAKARSVQQSCYQSSTVRSRSSMSQCFYLSQ